MKKLFLLLFILVFSIEAFAINACELNYLNAKEHLKKFEKDNQLWFLKLKEMELNSNFIQKLEPLEQDLKGAINEGIFLAKTSEKTYVLKMIPNNFYLDSYGYKILLQKHFADLGVAPNVRGIFALDDLKGLKSKFPEIGERSNIGVLMEYIPDGKVIKQIRIGTNSAPDLSSLPRDEVFRSEVREKLKFIEKNLNDLEVRANASDDLQIMINPKGDVHLIDFDFYQWNFDREERRRVFKKNNFSNILSLFK